MITTQNLGVAPVTNEGVTFCFTGHRLQLRADQNLTNQSTDSFDAPSSFVSLHFDQPRRYLGFAFTQFAMPVVGSPHSPFEWNPAMNIASPSAVIPLLAQADTGQITLLAPLDSWHDQIIAVDQDSSGVHRFRWGWHGDLDTIPLDTTATLGVYHASNVADVFKMWRNDLIEFRGSNIPARPTDPVTTHLSYWTDNGAAYWYRTERDRDMPTTLTEKMEEFERLDVPVQSVELDSWFYPHETSRPIADIETPTDPGAAEVPPTGMLEWKPRSDVLPLGVNDLHLRLGKRPLVLHARHISSASTYLSAPPEPDPTGDTEATRWWLDYGAHPDNPSFFGQWFDDAAQWGATCIEQDWMLMIWFGIRALRTEPGRALAWQQALDDAASEHGPHIVVVHGYPRRLLRHDRTRTYMRHSHLRRLPVRPRPSPTLELVSDRQPFRGSTRPSRVQRLFSHHYRSRQLGPRRRPSRTDRISPGRALRWGRRPRRPYWPHRSGNRASTLPPRRPLANPPISRWRSQTSRSFRSQTTKTSPGAETFSDHKAGRWRYIVAIHTSESAEALTGEFVLDEECLVYGLASPWRQAPVIDSGRARSPRLGALCLLSYAQARQRSAYRRTRRSMRPQVRLGSISPIETRHHGFSMRPTKRP